MISSRTLSKITIMVGRIRRASGTPTGSGLSSRQALDQAHHVVAEIAEQAGRHRRSALRQFDAALGDEVAQGLQRMGRATDSNPSSAGLAVDRGRAVLAAPDQVGLEADHRIAPARCAAFDRFQQEGVGAVAGQLHEGRDRRLEIADQRGDDDLGLAGGIAFREGLERRLDHGVAAFSLRSRRPRGSCWSG